MSNLPCVSVSEPCGVTGLSYGSFSNGGFVTNANKNTPMALSVIATGDTTNVTATMVLNSITYTAPFSGNTATFAVPSVDLCNLPQGDVYPTITACSVSIGSVPITVNTSTTEKVGVVIGDSIAQGANFFTNTISSELTANCGANWINKGIGSQTTSQVLARFQQDVINQNASCVVINAGINDIALGVDYTVAAANIQAMLNLLPAGTNVVLNGIGPWSSANSAQVGQINALNATLAGMMSTSGATVTFFDTMAWGSNGGVVTDPNLAYYGDPATIPPSTDGLHPYPQGYVAMASAIVNQVGCAYLS